MLFSIKWLQYWPHLEVWCLWAVFSSIDLINWFDFWSSIWISLVWVWLKSSPLISSSVVLIFHNWFGSLSLVGVFNGEGIASDLTITRQSLHVYHWFQFSSKWLTQTKFGKIILVSKVWVNYYLKYYLFYKRFVCFVASKSYQWI